MPLYDGPDFKLFMSLLRGGDKLEYFANEQLQRELDQHLAQEADAKYIDGVRDSSLFQSLPLEVRQHIWSYLVVVPESIHVYPVKRNIKQGFRLSRCGDTCINLTNGWCDCNSDVYPNPPAYLDTELLLVREHFTTFRTLHYFPNTSLLSEHTVLTCLGL